MELAFRGGRDDIGEMDTTETYAKTYSELWGVTWSADDINAAEFGVVIAAPTPTPFFGTEVVILPAAERIASEGD